MRALTFLLLSTCLAGGAFAQLAPSAMNGPGMGMPIMGGQVVVAKPSGGTPAAMQSIVNGKFVVGYDGRGDYLKNDQLERQNTLTADASPVALDGKARVAPVSAEAVKAAAAAAAPAKDTSTQASATAPAMRSDASLHSDVVKPVATAAPTTPPVNNNANNNNNTNNNNRSMNNNMSSSNSLPNRNNYSQQNSNPMVLIGGKVVHQ